MASEMMPGPSWAHKFFILPFTREQAMYRHNGRPDPHEDDRRPAISYEAGKGLNARNLDMAMLLKGIRDAVIIGGLILTWISPSLHPATPVVTPEKLAEALTTALTTVLDQRDAADEAKMKVAPTKTPAKPRPRVPPTTKPKTSSQLRDGEMIVTKEPAIPTMAHNVPPFGDFSR